MLNIIKNKMKNKRKRLDWSNYNSIEEIQEFIDQNGIETSTDFNKNFGGLARRVSKLGFKYSNFKFKRNINKEREKWTFLKTKSDIENYINKNNIKKFSDLEKSLRTRLERLGYISTDFFSPKYISWKDLTTKEKIQDFINKNNVKTKTEFIQNFPGLYKKSVKLGIYSRLVFINPKISSVDPKNLTHYKIFKIL